MKRLMLLSVAMVLASPVFAADFLHDNLDGGKEQFPRIKEFRLQSLQGRIAIMQQTHSCFQSSQAMEQMKMCQDKHRKMLEQHEQQVKAKKASLFPKNK